VEAALLALAGWLDAAGLSQWSRGSASVYPAANTLHLLGLVMLVGGIGAVDLRIAGLWPSIPVAPLSRALTPVALAGLVLLLASGMVLFAADARALAGSATFQRKLVLIGIALANAAAFRILWQQEIERGAGPPLPARFMAAASVLLWLAAGAHGRLIAYS
jgi:hypothetical protein